MYDIIGDIHGHYDLLLKLLDKLGYTKKDMSFKYPGRKVVFTGDFINRGPKIKQTIRLVRSMVEKGDALTIIGNHELNAILYATIDKSGKSLRKRLARYQLPLLKTLQAYDNSQVEFEDTIKWFRQLPVYLDLGGIRVVHGAWNDEHIATLNRYFNGEIKLKKRFLKEYLQNEELNKAVNVLIKGEELTLPKDLLVKDNFGIIRRSFRIKWWEPLTGNTFKDAAFGNRFELPSYTIPPEILPTINVYPKNEPPVFLGHYCLENKKLLYNGNICCIDTCITRTQHLSGYRWNGENTLDEKNIITV